MHALKHARWVRPYVGGKDLHDHFPPLRDRYAIYFGDAPEEVTFEYPDLREILLDRVYPTRSADTNTRRKRYWWQFEELMPEMYLTQSPQCRSVLHERM